MNKILTKTFLTMRAYKHQLLISFFGFSASCRQNPSCSSYTLAQIKKNGTIVGALQGLWRVINCRHF